MGGLVLGGWVPQNPKNPQPLTNEAWPHATSCSRGGRAVFCIACTLGKAAQTGFEVGSFEVTSCYFGTAQRVVDFT